MAWLSEDLAGVVEAAQRGDRTALESLLRELQGPVYRLAMRMLGGPDDASDATQEILLRVARHIGSFQRESSFTTWAYRVAANYLLTLRSRRGETSAQVASFDEAAQQLDAALAVSAGRRSEDRLLIEEVKLFCTHGMLLCLDREHRLAYILGEILELGSDEGAEILEITAEAFRKRLSRARASLHAFLVSRCGLVNRACECRCAKLVAPSIELGLLDPKRLRFAGQPSHDRAEQLRQDIDVFTSAAELFRSQPDYVAPVDFAKSLQRMLAERIE
jgi:RNA polymerase sigma factor (sigma-70 family)